MKNRGSAKEDGNPQRASFFFFFPARLRVLTFHLCPFPSPYEEKTKEGPLWRREGRLRLQAAQKPGSQKQTRISFSPQSRLSPQSLSPHRGQTHYACSVPAKNAQYNLDPELFCACRGERSRALGNPGARLSLIGFSKKNNKSVSDWSIQVCTRAVERAACLACERVFPQKC